MGRAFKIILAVAAGLIAGEAIAIGGYIIATNLFGLFDQDGGGAMGAIFMVGPALGLVLGVIAAFVVGTRKP
jgi:hypothetical protein